ncbi:MAG TPA: hypothetical protein VFX48_09460, partial [Saprospiraceae bacterium]|nr:hypothetical protein [Saprospiraceae bacterium]
MKKTLLFLLVFCSAFLIKAQQDSNLDSLVAVQGNEIKSLKKVKVSGYVQPQFQYAENKGIKYPGGDFGAQVDKRFSIRRGRVKIAYSSSPFEFVIVTENTERGISLHDFYGSYDFKKIGLKYTAGLFPRPFGFEQSYSTANHEGPER